MSPSAGDRWCDAEKVKARRSTEGDALLEKRDDARRGSIVSVRQWRYSQISSARAAVTTAAAAARGVLRPVYIGAMARLGYSHSTQATSSGSGAWSRKLVDLYHVG